MCFSLLLCVFCAVVAGIYFSSREVPEPPASGSPEHSCEDWESDDQIIQQVWLRFPDLKVHHDKACAERTGYFKLKARLEDRKIRAEEFEGATVIIEDYLSRCAKIIDMLDQAIEDVRDEVHKLATVIEVNGNLPARIDQEILEEVHGVIDEASRERGEMEGSL